MCFQLQVLNVFSVEVAAANCTRTICRFANATCLSVDHRSYYCLGEPYAIDVECDFNLRPCTAPNSRCKKGGVCDVATGLSGDCLNGFKGQQSAVSSNEIDDYADSTFDECLLVSPRCMNGSTCTNTMGGFLCNCTDDYRGRLCGQHKRPCRQSSPGQNGGTCSVVNDDDDDVDDAHCLCLSGVDRREQLTQTIHRFYF